MGAFASTSPFLLRLAGELFACPFRDLLVDLGDATEEDGLGWEVCLPVVAGDCLGFLVEVDRWDCTDGEGVGLGPSCLSEVEPAASWQESGRK